MIVICGPFYKHYTHVNLLSRVHAYRKFRRSAQFFPAATVLDSVLPSLDFAVARVLLKFLGENYMKELNSQSDPPTEG